MQRSCRVNSVESQLNIRALEIYIHGSIEALARTTREVAIDETYGTNNAGMDLFTLLAELDGTGFPMAYLFVEKKSLSGMASCGSLKQILDQFLRPIKELHHLAPSFVRDKCDPAGLANG